MNKSPADSLPTVAVASFVQLITVPAKDRERIREEREKKRKRKSEGVKNGKENTIWIIKNT